MRITAILHSAPPFRRVGGEICTLTLLEEAAKHHDVSIVCLAWHDEGSYKGIRIVPKNHRTESRWLMKQADLIVTHPELVTAHHFPNKIGLIHNLNGRTQEKSKKSQWQALIANSQYSWDNLRKQGVEPTHLIYPPTIKPRVARKPEYVFVSNLSKAKGVDIVRRAAQDLDYPFMGVQGGYNPQEALENVLVVGHGPLDVGFSYARVMLAPSRSETYGMAIAEAAMLGIPVVASDIPAHREVLGSAGVYVDLNADQSVWNAAIEKAWHMEPQWDRARFLEQRSQDSVDQFLALLDRHSPKT